VDLDAPFRTYWPEMEAATTVRQVLSHQSGHVLLDRISR
jgi:CubicO group peptidase (beta-lactamase class C family)